MKKKKIARIMKAAANVVEFRLNGNVWHTDVEGRRIIASFSEPSERTDEIYIFFVDWDTDDFPDPKITKREFEKALYDFEGYFYEPDLYDASIKPGHIALCIRGEHSDRAFVRATMGVELK